MKSQVVLPSKKPYCAPKLFVYGDLTEMTQAMGFAGMKDGGMFLMRKTG
jgi:hypothetical protein